MKALKIDPDGTMQPVGINGDTIEQQNDSIYEHLGGYFDTVRLSDDAIMLVDDEGLLKCLPRRSNRADQRRCIIRKAASDLVHRTRLQTKMLTVLL